jgi:hypothetical protein
VVTSAARAAAERALTAVPGPWIYARVDGVERDDRFLVMELEVIEPTLFLAWSPEAARRLARVIVDLT